MGRLGWELRTLLWKATTFGKVPDSPQTTKTGIPGNQVEAQMKTVFTCGETFLPGTIKFVGRLNTPCAKLFILVKKLAFSINKRHSTRLLSIHD